MGHTSLPVTDKRTRFEWVKMFYPDMPKGTPTGIIRQPPGSSLWVFDHRTPESQWSDRFNSPMGIDVGTLAHLFRLNTPIIEVHWGEKGSTDPLYAAPLALFKTVSPVVVQLSGGAPRTRVFLPITHWVQHPWYEPVEPLYWTVTHLTENGTVTARHTDDREKKK